MKISILHNLHSGPWGGGNQFLKVLKNEFIRMGVYADNLEEAEVVLFNSYQQLADVLKLKSKYPDKLFIHRLGPVFHYHRGKSWRSYDEVIIDFTNKISDGVIFQSNWSFDEAKKLGFVGNSKVIHNAVNGALFNKQDRIPFENNRKVKLISTSWSSNPMKGFEYYKYLDENLDFSKYEMTFIGNSPLRFKNITWYKPEASEELAKKLKQSDIFIFPAKYEACSNALIEAMSCGLPVVVLDSGSNKELVQAGGELFITEQDLIDKIDKVSKNYSSYQELLSVSEIEKTAKHYYESVSKVFEEVNGKPKKISFLIKLGLQKKLFIAKIKTRWFQNYFVAKI